MAPPGCCPTGTRRRSPSAPTRRCGCRPRRRSPRPSPSRSGPCSTRRSGGRSSTCSPGRLGGTAGSAPARPWRGTRRHTSSVPTYGDAIVWVAATADANACSRGTNGDFVTGDPVGVPLAAMLSGQAMPDGKPCDSSGLGRLDDDRTLAPEGSPLVTVCRLDTQSTWQATQLDASRSARGRRAAALAADAAHRPRVRGVGRQRATPASRSCCGMPPGPAVRISVDPECSPGVLGSGVESPDAGPLVALVEPWSPPIPGPDPDGSVSSP